MDFLSFLFFVSGSNHLGLLNGAGLNDGFSGLVVAFRMWQLKADGYTAESEYNIIRGYLFRAALLTFEARGAGPYHIALHQFSLFA